MNDVKQVIIIRKDLNMRKGKMIAQGSHASMKIFFDIMGEQFIPGYDWNRCFSPTEEMKMWIDGLFKKIVVGAESLTELTDVYQAAKTAGLPCSLIEDAGLTEFGGEITITACAIGPAEAEKIDKITGKLKLL